MQRKRIGIAAGAIVATVASAFVAFGLAMGLIRDPASDGAGRLSSVIVETRSPSGPSVTPNRAGSPVHTAVNPRDDEGEHGLDADD